MKITIFGATGALGLELTKMALSMGHAVKALVRNPAKLTISHDNLAVIQGDVMQIASVEAALADQDIVLSALGVGKSTKPTVTYSQGTQNMIDAMDQSGISRFVCVSSAGVEDHPSFPFFYRFIIRPLLLKNVYRDMAELEKRVKNSNLDWSIIQPYTLTNGPLTKQYRTAVNNVIPKGSRISRADVAHLMLETAFRQGEKEAITIAY